MEKDTKKVPSDKWKPQDAYLKKVTLQAAIRQNRDIEREIVTEHWKRANKK